MIIRLSGFLYELRVYDLS